MTSFLVFEGRFFQGVFTNVLLHLMFDEAVLGGSYSSQGVDGFGGLAHMVV